MKARVIKVVVSAVVLVVVAGASYTVGAMQGAKPVNMPFASMKWEPMGPGSPLQAVQLWGDRTKSADQAFLLKIPGGFEAGGHSHTAAYHAIGIQGAWIHTNDSTNKGGQYPVGSYVYQPGKAVHNDICKGPGECIVFVHQHGPNDFIPAK